MDKLQIIISYQIYDTLPADIQNRYEYCFNHGISCKDLPYHHYWLRSTPEQKDYKDSKKIKY